MYIILGKRKALRICFCPRLCVCTVKGLVCVGSMMKVSAQLMQEARRPLTENLDSGYPDHTNLSGTHSQHVHPTYTLHTHAICQNQICNAFLCPRIVNIMEGCSCSWTIDSLTLCERICKETYCPSAWITFFRILNHQGRRPHFFLSRKSTKCGKSQKSPRTILFSERYYIQWGLE